MNKTISTGSKATTSPGNELSYKTHYGEWKVRIRLSNYSNNGNLAVLLVADIDGEEEPFGCITVNLNEILLPNQAYLDTNNCEGIERFVVKNKLGKPVGTSKTSGFCTYPLYEFDLNQCRLHLAPEWC